MTHDNAFLETEYQRIRATAYALAGGLTDLPQRASVYFHLYEDSGGRNVFPLIAAHGALWGAGYFAKGLWAGKWLSLQYGLQPGLRRRRLHALQQFADQFRDINRRVCAEAYGAYHFSKHYGHTVFAAERIPPRLLRALNQCHASCATGAAFSPESRQELFDAFFLWEQDTIVAQAVHAAVAQLDWPLAKALAMRPRITFAYFARGRGLQFRNFADQDERIRHGRTAYAVAEQVGLGTVEAAIANYGIMPALFLQDSRAHFANQLAAAP
jgi:hypothetical protein